MNDDVRTNISRTINTEVERLAREILTKEEITEAEHIITLAFSDNPDENEKSGQMLVSLIPVRPKRPLYYVNGEVSHGPRMVTRYVVRDLCAYINILLDDLTKDLGGYKKFIPYGRTLNKIKGKISPELYFKLDKYNKIFYVPAKHKYDLYEAFDLHTANDHLFSLKDAIYCCFITMKLRAEILPISETARQYIQR